MSQDKKTVKFHYKKSNLFRVLHADGAWGGLTPEGNIFFTFYNSRPPIPEVLVQPVEEDGTLGPEIPELKVSKDGIVREVEVGVTMTPENVQSLIEFLKGRLEHVEKIRSMTRPAQEPKTK